MKSVIKKNCLITTASLVLIIFVVYKMCVLDLVWEISSDESIAWKECAISSNAVKIEQTESQAELIKQSLFLVIPLIVTGCAFVILCKRKRIYEVSKAGFIVGSVLSFLLQPLHELLHGIAFPNGSTVYIGIITRNFSGYATSTASMTMVECIIYHLFPVVVLGFVPLFLFIIDKDKKRLLYWALYGFAFIGFIQTAPDWFGLYPIITQAPHDALIQMSGWDTYWFVP